MNLELFDMNIV